MGLLQWNKVFKLGEDEVLRPPVVALIKHVHKGKCSEDKLSAFRNIWKSDITVSVTAPTDI